MRQKFPHCTRFQGRLQSDQWSIVFFFSMTRQRILTVILFLRREGQLVIHQNVQQRVYPSVFCDIKYKSELPNCLDWSNPLLKCACLAPYRSCKFYLASYKSGNDPSGISKQFPTNRRNFQVPELNSVYCGHIFSHKKLIFLEHDPDVCQNGNSNISKTISK